MTSLFETCSPPLCYGAHKGGGSSMVRRGREAAERLLDTAEAEVRLAFAGGRAEARSLSRACVAGEAVEVSQGYYARASYFEALPQRARAMHLIRAMARKHPERVFASFSAALVHGLQVTNRLTGIVRLAMGARENRSIRDARIKCHLIRDESYELVSGIRVTPLRATVLDCLCQALSSGPGDRRLRSPLEPD